MDSDPNSQDEPSSSGSGPLAQNPELTLAPEHTTLTVNTIGVVNQLIDFLSQWKQKNPLKKE